MKEESIENRLKWEWSAENDPGIEWGAVAWAALISAIVFLVAGSIATARTQAVLAESGTILNSSPWTFIKLTASIILGPSAIFESLSFLSFLMGIIIHLIIAIIGTVLLVLVLHRWGLLVGLIGGALFGWALYAVNFYLLADLWFNWFAGLTSVSMGLAHMLWGATAGTVYELLDED